MKKQIAILLVCLITVQLASFGASARGEAYTGTILAAINTNYDDLMQDFAAESASTAVVTTEPADDAAAQEDFLDGPQTDEPEPLSAADAARLEALYGDEPQQAAVYEIGSRKTIHSSYRDDYDTDAVELECIYISPNCTVWLEQGCGKTEEDCIAFTDEFEKVLPQEWALFGDHRIDTDGDGKIALFFYDMNDVGGYFRTWDLIDARGRIGSVWVNGSGNRCDCVHLYPRADLNTLVHEYQHYLHAGWKYDGKNNLTIKRNSHESYFNEGFSGCAEYLLGTHNRAYSFSSAANDPTTFSLVNWHFDSRSYSISYVFCQYLRTRYALLTNDLDSPIPGSAIFRIIQQTRSEKRVKNTLTIAANLLYPTEDYPQLKTADSRCRQLLTDFWLAALRKDAEGVYGFNGESWADCIEMDVHSELPADGSPLIRSGMAIFYLIPYADPQSGKAGTATVTRAGGEMRFCTVDGIGRLLVLNWNDETLPDEYRMVRTETTTLQIRHDAFVPGRSLIGWARTPDAAAAELTEGNTVRLAENASTVLYAVWEEAKELTPDATVRLEKASHSCVRFTPDANGCYLFSWQYGDAVGVYADEERLTEEPCASYSSNQACFSLRAHEPVELRFIAYRWRAGSVRVERVTQQFVLQYIYTLRGETYTETACGDTCYRMMILDTDVLNAARADGLCFSGWSEEPDAATSQYAYESEICLEKDTTLYAVWTQIPEITADADQTLPTGTNIWYGGCAFSFTPQSSGTYRFYGTQDAPSYFDFLTVYGADGVCLRDLNSETIKDGAWELTLQGGQKYTFHYWSGDMDTESECTVRMDKITDAPSAQLCFSAKSEPDTVMGAWKKTDEIILCRRCVYTVPHLDPCARDGRVCVGWSESPSNEYAKVWKAGDKIEPIIDMTLYPVWENTAQTRFEASGFVYVLRAIRYVFGFIDLFLREIAHIRLH